MIKEQYISFETAKLAKEKGFDEEFENMHVWNNFKGEILEDVSGYNMKNSHLCKNSYSAPTQSLLARWLREVHNMCVEVYSTGYGFIWCICDTDSGTDRRFSNETGSNDSGAWDTYEDAMEAGLQDALKLL